MSLPFSLFLALRYLRPKRTFQSVITLLTILGVLIGVMVLVVVISVMNGFDEMWTDKILSFNAHITIDASSAFDAEPAWLEDVEAVEGVTGAAPYVQGLAFFNHSGRVFSPLLRGIDPAREARVSRIPEHITAGRFSVKGDEVVIGADLARTLDLQVGDTVLVYSPQSFTSAEEIRLPEELTVAGVFDLGMYDFDLGYALCSLPMARSLFGLERGVTGVQVMTRDPSAAPRVAQAVEERVGPVYRVRTWMEQNRQLFGALQVEKNMMFFLLGFIMLVAGFAIAITLVTVAIQKTREIGLLKALGFSNGEIMGIFLWQGWIAGVIGSLLGLASGLLALHYRNDLLQYLNRHMGLQLLPESLYQLAEIPASTSWEDLGKIALIVIVFCTLAGLLPAIRTACLDPARALRYE